MDCIKFDFLAGIADFFRHFASGSGLGISARQKNKSQESKINKNPDK
jgi:hypothetical protein